MRPDSGTTAAASVPTPLPLPLPDLYARQGNSGGRALAFGAVIAVHIAAGWALMQVDSVRTAVREASPIFVDLIAPPAPPPPPPPPVKPPPPAPAPKVIPKPVPTPIVTAKPSPAPAPFVAPPPPVEVPTPAPAPVVEAPPAPPPPPPPAPPAEPKTVPATAVRYLEAPSPVYPAASRRMRETGRVVLRALINKQGVPRQVLVQTSSTHERLDEAAKAAVNAARFQPYTENGTTFEVWVLIPIEFNLEDR